MIKAVVIGTSAGGLAALEYLLPKIPRKSQVSIFVVQHISADSDSYFILMLKKLSQLKVKEPCSTEEILPGTIYIAPPDYHLLIEPDFTMSLSYDAKVNYSRPSIDLLFESAAEAYQHQLLGILLTGSNNDGSKGLKQIHNMGGITIVQNPETAFMSAMPHSALKLFQPTAVLNIEEIAKHLANLPEFILT